MALISCPECGKQISDTAPACPHCGYVLSPVNNAHRSSAEPCRVPEKTKIGETKTSLPVGIACIIFGILIILIGIPFIGVFGLGIFAIIGGVAIFCVGYAKVSGTQDAYCPYCGKLSQIGKGATNFKCPMCKKISVRSGEYLEPPL